MTEVTDNEQKVLRLGELLTQVGIVQPNELTEAIQTSSETGLPIGRVLIMSGYLTDQELQAAVQAQPEMPSPLVNLAVERVPQSGHNSDPIVASMLLSSMKGEQGFAGNAGADFVKLAQDKRTFEEALNAEFPEKYKMLKDHAKNLRLELCLPADSSLEQIAERLHKLRTGQISRYSCRQA